MKKCRVSVVIPTRDNLDVLPKALDSVQGQNIEDLEIIVANDGSTDGTATFLSLYQKQDPRLRILETGGKGPANARNRAISVARSPLIAFLDADDWWHPGKLKRQIAYLEAKPEIGFSFTDYLHIDPEGNTYGTCFEYWQPAYGNRPPQAYDLIEQAEADLLGSNVCGTSTVVARLELLQKANGFATSLPSAEDWDMWLRLAGEAPVASTSIVTTSYLMRPGSETGRRKDRLTAAAQIIERYRSRKEPEFKAAIRKAEARIHASKADIAGMEGRYWSAVSGELMALAVAPSMRNARSAASYILQGLRQAFEAADEKSNSKASKTPATKSSKDNAAA